MKKQSSTNEEPRIFWALERTYLAWVRTGLALMGLGFVIARFSFFFRALQLSEISMPSTETNGALWVGIFLILLGVLVLTGALRQYLVSAQRIEKGEVLNLKPSLFGIVTTMFLILIGIGTAMYLISKG